MRQVTLVLTYYDNPSMLSEQLSRFKNIPMELRRHIHLVLVDDASPTFPVKERIVDTGLASIQVFRVKKNVRWNQDACRNIAVKHADTEWVLMTDIDHVVPSDTWHQVILSELDAGCVYTFRRVVMPDFAIYKHHPNSWLMTRTIYEKAGGYDERFAGWYGTDGDFRNRLQRVASIVQLNVPLELYPRSVISDASTTSFQRKTSADRMNIERIKLERGKSYQTVRYRFDYEQVQP